jgi:NAD(P)-dependent dehydrogenase (short-subunit alcohol dehydrogenase family)
MNQSTQGQHRLSGKVAIVTGATGGIGEATAKLFLREGASVMLVGRSEDKLRETLYRIGVSIGVAHYVADATDEGATANAVKATIDTFGGVDIMFANAGTEGRFNPIETLSKDDFEQVLGTNVIGVWLSMKYCVEPMKKRGGGSIIATASIAGVIGSPAMAPYIASKHAVIGMVKTAALELGPSKIRVNAIAPGAIDNRMIRSLETQYSPEAPDSVRADLNTKIALQRYGTNEEVAQLALFLASDESSYCTGGTYLIDGGYTAA